jgi:hypothetical protein
MQLCRGGRQAEAHIRVAFLRDAPDSVGPDPLLASGIASSVSVHLGIQESKTSCHRSNEKAAGRTSEVPGGIALRSFGRFPDPLGNDLPDSSTRVMHSDGEWDTRIDTEL